MNIKKTVVTLCMQLLFCTPTMYAAPFAYVSSQGNAVFIIDVATNTLVKTITIEGALQLSDIAITPNNKYAYLTDITAEAIWVLDLATNTLAAGPISTGQQSTALVISPDGNYAYISNAVSASLSILTIATNTVSAPISLPTLNQPFFIAITPDGNTLYVGDISSNFVLPIDVTNPTSPVVGTRFAVGTNIGIAGIAITPDSNTAYVNNVNDNKVYPVNITNRLTPSVGAGVSVGSGQQPYDISLTSDGTRAYVSTEQGDIKVLDLTTNPATLIDTITVGGHFYDLALTSDNKNVYAANKENSNVTVIQTIDNTSVAGTPIFLGISSTPSWVAITSTTQAPTTAIGTLRNNIFLDKTERILVITWTASTSANIVSYNIYNGSTLVANVLATNLLCFPVLLTDCDNGQSFSITAVNKFGIESAPGAVVVE